jgi:hypothetical protein
MLRNGFIKEKDQSFPNDINQIRIYRVWNILESKGIMGLDIYNLFGELKMND